MRLALTVVSPAARRQADVLLEADPATPVGTIAEQLDRLLHSGTVAPPPGRPGGEDGAAVLRFPGPRTPADVLTRASLYVDHTLIPPGLPLGESPIRPGCVVSLGDPSGSLRPEPAGVVEIQVAGGPAAGSVHRLTLGGADIGGDGTAHIRLNDPALPPAALHVSVSTSGVCTVEPYDGVTVTLDNAPLTGPVTWSPGQLVTV